MYPFPSSLPAVAGSLPAPLTTGSVVEDVALGVGLAVVLFALYYWVLLRPARRGARGRTSNENHTSRRDTGN